MELPDLLGVVGLPFGTRRVGDVCHERGVQRDQQAAEDLAGLLGLGARSHRVQLSNDVVVLGLVDPRHGAHRAAQDRAGQQVAVVLDVGLGQRRAHAVAERDEREVRVLGFGDVGELLDVSMFSGRRNGIAVNTIVNQPQNKRENVTAASMRDFPSLIPEIPLPTRLKTNRFERGQGGVGAVDLVAAGPPAGMPASRASVIIFVASSGLVANSTSSGTPATARPSASSAQSFGRYSRRSISVCPFGAAYARYTATCAFSIRPVVPVYCRCTPTVRVPFFTSPVSSSTNALTSANTPTKLDLRL